MGQVRDQRKAVRKLLRIRDPVVSTVGQRIISNGIAQRK
jgi:hypothetical protein